MLAKILASFFVIIGIWFLLKRESLRRKLQRKSKKILRRYLSAVALFFGLLFISAGWKTPGVVAKIFTIFGILAIIKGFFLLKAKISDKLIEWWTNQPVFIYRIWASMYIIIGILLLLEIRK